MLVTSNRFLPAETVERIVADHGHKTRRAFDGTVEGGIAWSKHLPNGTFETGIEWTPVPATVPELRDWLGY